MPRDPDQGVINFPGIEGPISASYTLSHGTDPARIIIQCNPQKNTVFQVGFFTMQWKGTIIRVPDCRILSDYVTLNDGGFVTSVTMEDYRWKWRYPVISGEYNVRNAYQSVYKPTKKNPQQLAKLITKAMGIADGLVNVAALPTDDYPYMQWYSSPAANELSSLAERYGCRVVPWPDGRVNIFRIGEGNPLPANLPTGTDTMGVVTPAGPDVIEVNFGPSKYRVICKLEPVGLDVDGSVQAIDDLSYRPTDGWEFGGAGHEDPGSFWKLQDYLSSKYGAATQRRAQFAFIMDLARRSIFKWYRIKLQMPKDSFAGKFKIPGYPLPVESISQLLPIDDRVVNVSLDPYNPAEIKDGAKDTDLFWDTYDQTMVWGDFFKRSMCGLDPVDPDHDAFNKPVGNNFYPPGGYSIDRERGIVQFDDYVYTLQDNDGTPGSRMFPDLALSFMCSPRDKVDRKMYKYYVERRRTDITPAGTQALVLLHPEFQMVHTFDMNVDGTPGPSRAINQKLLDKVANYYIDAELRKFRKQEPRSKQYNGLWPIYTDGAIREVTFTMNPDGGMETTACFNDERQPYILPYETRRRNQRVEAGLNVNQFAPPVFTTQPQTFPYNLGSAYIVASPSRR